MSVPIEWRDVISDIQDILVDNCVLISKYTDDSGKANMIEEISTVMKEICEANKSFNDHKKALQYCQNINTKGGQEEDDDDDDDEIEVDYNSEYQKKLADLKRGNKYNPEMDQMFKDFKERVDDLTSNDFEMEESDMNFLDPITKQTMKQPVKSQTCGHVFDKDSINSMFQMSRDSYIRCPYVGCPNKLKKKDIQTDEVLSQKFQRFQESQR